MLKLRLILLIIFTTIAVIIGTFWFRVNNLSNSDLSVYLFSDKNADVEIVNTNYEESLRFENINEKEPLPQESLKFLFFGDIMLDRYVETILEESSVTGLLANLKDTEKSIFSNKDIIGANLEGVVTNDGAHYNPVNKFDFAFSIEKVNKLKDYNFNYFSLANNHFFDQGSRGIMESRENLKKSGFYYSGSPNAQVDSNSKYIIEIKGKKAAMISLSMVYKYFDIDDALSLVKQAALETDLVVVNIHWGDEYEHSFNIYQKEVGRSLIDAGADIIIGHHPHVVQGLEIYKGRPIFYSLGNFIFDQYFSPDTQKGLALEILYSEDIISINLLPFKSHQSAPTFMQGEEKKIFLQKFSNWSSAESEILEEVKGGVLEILIR